MTQIGAPSPMQTITSRDGTTIAYDRRGEGDPVILVDGALCSRQLGPFPEAAEALARGFDVVHYDRRGRGESTDESAGRFEIDREVEDLEALIERVGGQASLIGMSSGGALAIEAANRLSGVRQVIVYEVPYITDPAATFPRGYTARMRELVQADRRSEAVRFFLATVGMPAPLIQLTRLTPLFRKLKLAAHTLPYDAELVVAPLGDARRLQSDRWTSIEAPVTVVCGGKSPEYMLGANAALARVLGARQLTLDGQNHMIKGKALAPTLAQLLAMKTGGAGVTAEPSRDT